MRDIDSILYIQAEFGVLGGTQIVAYLLDRGGSPELRETARRELLKVSDLVFDTADSDETGELVSLVAAHGVAAEDQDPDPRRTR